MTAIILKENDYAKARAARLPVIGQKCRVYLAKIEVAQPKAWAVGTMLGPTRFSVRRVFWGRLLARAEKRPGEVVRRIYLTVIA